MDRVILHCDLNNFFASVECLYHPELSKLPVAVGGDESARHGIVLAKNYRAKACGIKTGEPLFSARKKCPNLVVLRADYAKYLRFSAFAMEIYSQYTDCIESFGIDEAWLDVTGSTRLFGSGEEIAHKIREQIKRELGITVSVGVSWNKIFAKLGSDLKKPDAVSIISRENYIQLLGNLNINELLYVGRASAIRLNRLGIYTIQQLAETPPDILHSLLGKGGFTLSTFARGEDISPVNSARLSETIKSIGNSITPSRNLESEQDVKGIFYVLSQSIAVRLRQQGLLGTVVQITIRDASLNIQQTQKCIPAPTCISGEICTAAMELFLNKWNKQPLRSVGISVSGLTDDAKVLQLSLLQDEQYRMKLYDIEYTLDNIREKYGDFCIGRASLLVDKALTGFHPVNNHTFTN